MSESPTDSHRLQFVVSEVLYSVGSLSGEALDPERGVAPGSLTSKEEERETWTAESLRTALSRKEKSFHGVRSDKTSAVDV
jgi:hypothetical protein